jgi:crotonobetainyl-CoA:carnitine CoA-transferase CaiB-like acyl-CoA transferase
MADGILQGVRVIELGTGHAVAVAGLLLAEAGAEVVKVEAKSGAEARNNASFAVWNRSKKSVVIDPAAADSLATLLAGADVLLTDLTPAVRQARGLGDTALAAAYPGLIRATIGGWPAGHPLAERPVDDTIVLAESGLMDEQSGVRPGPIYLRFPLGSWGAAYFAATGIVARLIQRGRGRGTGSVATSLLQGAMAPTAMLWRRAERPTPAFTASMAKGMRSPQFECADGVWLHVKSTPDDAPLMRAALDALGPDGVARHNEGIAGDHICPNFGANAHIFRTRPSAEWLADLWAADVAVQPDVPMGTIYDDEQAQANGFVVAVDDPVFGATRQPGPPLTVTPPMAVRNPAPRLDANVVPEWPALTPTAPADALPPLAGIRVVDFGAFLAGPFAAMLLADLGADVVKVEPLSGDIMRRVDGAFLGCQRGKRSLALDLKSPAAAEIVGALAGWADIVHHNIRLPAAQRLGIAPEQLAALNPALITCHVSSYGAVGPRKDWPGYDQLVQAQTGWEYEGAGAGNQPMWHRFGMMDHQGALASLLATLLALYHRDRGHGGQAVSASILGAGMLTVSETIVGPDGSLTPFHRLDSQQLGVGPGRRLYQCRDGWIAMVADDAALARVDVDKFADGTIAEAMMMIAAAGGVAVEARTAQRDGFFDDASNRDLGLVVNYPHARFGRLEMVGAFWHFEGRPAVAARPHPEIGADSRTVLSDIGYATDRTAALIANGVVGAPAATLAERAA